MALFTALGVEGRVGFRTLFGLIYSLEGVGLKSLEGWGWRTFFGFIYSLGGGRKV